MEKSIISSDILFSRHNLVTDGVFKECQLILCALIYFNEDLQNKVLELLSKFTNTWLALGNKETLRFSSIHDKFKVIDSEQKKFTKR
jgi:chemotaxis protein methyltransferase CheR